MGLLKKKEMVKKPDKTYRKMTGLEKKKARKIKKAQKDAKYVEKKVATTLDWIDIDDVLDDRIILKKGSKSRIVKGIKIEPHDILFDDDATQAAIINRLRLVYNKINSELFFNFVLTPVDADDHIAELLRAQKEEDDLACKQMIVDDFNKIYTFQHNAKELEFFIMIKTKDDKDMDKEFSELFYEFRNAGFNPKMLNKRDYYNYLAFVFENPLINDFYFSRGIFSYKNMDMEYNEDTDEYEEVDHTELFSDYGSTIQNTNRPAEKLIRKSKLAPTAFGQQKDKIIIGDKYVRNLLVTALPQNFFLGLLCEYINMPNIKIYMTSSHLDMNISAMLKKDYQDKEQQLQKTRDPSLQQRLTNELSSLHEYIEESIRNNDKTNDITIVFSIIAENDKELNSSTKDLKQYLFAKGFKVQTAMYLQEMLLKETCPLWVSNPMPATIKENFGIPLASDGLAGLYPFIFETLKDPKGFLLGEERMSGGIVLFDPFFYLNNKRESQVTQRINGNSIIVGTSGSGKSTTMSLIIRHLIRIKSKIIWIDPENKNRSLTKRYGGTYVAWGKRGNVINVFDLKPISTDEDEVEENAWDTEKAIYDVISDVNQVLQFLYPDLDKDILSVTSRIVFKAYERVGICKDENGVWKSFKGLSSEDMPTFKDFSIVLKERIQEISNDKSKELECTLLNKLDLSMERILNEWSTYFVGHTTVNLTKSERKIISFGTKDLFNVSKELREALNHIMFKYSWNLCLDDSENSAFIIDEAHTMILEGSTAPLVAQFFRRSRKYKNIMLLGTQEPRDFADERVITHGKAIFNNAAYKLIMLLNKDATNDVAKLINLNINEINQIGGFQQGEGLFVVGDRRMPIHVIATEVELNEMGA